MAVAVLVTHDGTAMGSTKEQGASVSGVVLGATCGARDLPPAKLPRDGSQRSWRAIRSAATSLRGRGRVAREMSVVSLRPHRISCLSSQHEGRRTNLK